MPFRVGRPSYCLRCSFITSGLCLLITRLHYDMDRSNDKHNSSTSGDLNTFMSQHEDLLLTNLVAHESRERLRTLLRSAKGRKKMRERLAHFQGFDPRWIRPIPSDRQSAKAIYEQLREMGAPLDCYMISERSALDGKCFPLNEVIQEIVGSGIAAILSCIPGRLGYFEGEGSNNRFIIFRS